MTNGNTPINPRNQTLGLTKREHFAGLALQGLLARSDMTSIDAASIAVKCADALLDKIEATKVE